MERRDRLVQGGGEDDEPWPGLSLWFTLLVPAAAAAGSGWPLLLLLLFSGGVDYLLSVLCALKTAL